MNTRILLSLCFSSLCLFAATTFTGSDRLSVPSVWPVDTYEILQVTLSFSLDDDLDARDVYCDLASPGGAAIGTYSTEVDADGTAVFAFATSALWHCGESGAFTLANLRILTPEGFAAVTGTYRTQEYPQALFRPDSQSTLLSCDNGVETQLEEESLLLDFRCPEESSSLPEFLFDNDTVFDGYAVAIDNLLEDISFVEEDQPLFQTATYAGCDTTTQAIQCLSHQGDGDANLEAGEALSLKTSIQWNSLEDGAENPEEFVYLVFFYHTPAEEYTDPEAVVVHPFDSNSNLQLSKSELDDGQELWIGGSVSPQFLLEAISLCDATTYCYDEITGHFFPYWP